MTRREQVRGLFARASGRPARWAVDGTSLGDFEGREHTLELFDVPASEQRDLRRALRSCREEARSLLGYEVHLLFHTPEATTLYYADVREDAPVAPKRGGPVVRTPGG